MTAASFEAQLATVFPGVVFKIERLGSDDMLVATIGNVSVSTWDGRPAPRSYMVRVESVHAAAYTLDGALLKFRALVQNANRGLALLETP